MGIVVSILANVAAQTALCASSAALRKAGWFGLTACTYAIAAVLSSPAVLSKVRSALAVRF
jgi:hypothetical protein